MKLSEFRSKLSLVWTGILSLGAVIGTIIGVQTYIDHRINEVISSSEFIQNVARAANPSLILDERGSVIVDDGGLAHVRKIDFEYDKTKWEGRLPVRIIVTPVNYMRVAPLLSNLGGIAFSEKHHRGSMTKWIYEISYGSVWDDALDCHFRVEVLDKGTP
ncbi:MAG: hypothetical protein K9M54_06800 [Kiritimatiellales bacterium]|nr:hypothetical protein [Kiritimatiellales bacterium]MCF7864150.1 hypothetical protein [Kiritimatiellales bacterium]